MYINFLLLLSHLVQPAIAGFQKTRFEYSSSKFEYFDKSLQKNILVDVEIYSPGKNVQFNGHLVMIANGMAVPAKEYSSLSEKLSSLGYFVVTPDYKKFIPFLNGIVTVASMDVLHTLLQQLIYAQENDDSNLPNQNFKDAIIFGHSRGGAFAIIDNSNNEIDESIENYFSDYQEDYYWDEYVKGVVAFEGWREGDLPLPKKNKFLVQTGSQYYREVFQMQSSLLSEEEKSLIDFYVFYDANHYLINNFHGPKQIVPGASIAQNQDNFTTTFEEWESGQNAYVKLLDSAIETRLLLQNTNIEKI